MLVDEVSRVQPLLPASCFLPSVLLVPPQGFEPRHERSRFQRNSALSPAQHKLTRRVESRGHF